MERPSKMPKLEDQVPPLEVPNASNAAPAQFAAPLFSQIQPVQPNPALQIPAPQNAQLVNPDLPIYPGDQQVKSAKRKRGPRLALINCNHDMLRFNLLNNPPEYTSTMTTQFNSFGCPIGQLLEYNDSIQRKDHFDYAPLAIYNFKHHYGAKSICTDVKRSCRNKSPTQPNEKQHEVDRILADVMVIEKGYKSSTLYYYGRWKSQLIAMEEFFRHRSNPNLYHKLIDQTIPLLAKWLQMQAYALPGQINNNVPPPIPNWLVNINNANFVVKGEHKDVKGFIFVHTQKMPSYCPRLITHNKQQIKARHFGADYFERKKAKYDGKNGFTEEYCRRKFQTTPEYVRLLFWTYEHEVNDTNHRIEWSWKPIEASPRSYLIFNWCASFLKADPVLGQFDLVKTDQFNGVYKEQERCLKSSIWYEKDPPSICDRSVLENMKDYLNQDIKLEISLTKNPLDPKVDLLEIKLYKKLQPQVILDQCQDNFFSKDITWLTPLTLDKKVDVLVADSELAEEFAKDRVKHLVTTIELAEDTNSDDNDVS